VGLPQICWSGFASLAQVFVQTESPDHVRGRTMSIYVTSITAMMPLGTLLIGSLGSVVGESAALQFGGVVTVLAGVAVLALSPAVRAAEVGRRGARA
jgi:MFS family permease